MPLEDNDFDPGDIQRAVGGFAAMADRYIPMDQNCLLELVNDRVVCGIVLLESLHLPKIKRRDLFSVRIVRRWPQCLVLGSPAS